MSWSAQFISDLGATSLTPLWRLQRVQLHTEAGAETRIYSHTGSPRIRRVRIDGAALNDYEATTTWGRTVVELVGDDLGALAAAGPRGTFWALYLGFPGYTEDEYQRVAFGQWRQLSGRKPAWTLEIIDAATGLRQRPVNATGETSLFYDLDGDTTTTADYVTADTGLTVSSTTGFVRKTADDGIIHVTPASGEPFWLRWDSISPTQFTVDTTDEIGTVRIDTVTGATVTRAALLEDHPIVIALQVLTSTGGGANGSWDVLPTAWGLAVPVGYVDYFDAFQYAGKVAIVSSGSYLWSVALIAPEADGFGWLSGLLAAGGFYMTMRQGSITVRAIQQSISPIAALTDWRITDADVVDVQHEWWSSEHVTEYGSTAVTTASASTSHVGTDVYQRPSAVVYTYDLSDRLWSNQSAVRDEMLNRLVESREITPEALTLTLRGWWWAQMTPGDLGWLSCSRVVSRWFGSLGFVAQRCKIVQVSPEWDTAPVTVVRVLVYAAPAETWA
jgi:hypothetical protein